MNWSLLKKLTSCFGTSGNEEEVSDIILKELEGVADDIKIDPMGNVIAVKKSKYDDAKKLMVTAHMDEIGVIITYIEKEGFLRFASIGGLNMQISAGQRVRFKNGTVGVVAYEDKYDTQKGLKPQVMYIDIGAKDLKDAQKLVSIGDTAVFCGDFYENENIVISKALDDRAGVFLLLEAFKELNDPAYDVYAVFTSQEEIGLRGAKASAYTVEPDFALAIDVTDTGDTPNSNPMAVKLGGGVCIKLKDNSIITHKKINDLLKDTAEKNNIDFQYEILTFGGCDAGAIHTVKGGAVTGALSIPTRHIHTPCEMISKKDAESLLNLLVRFIEK